MDFGKIARQGKEIRLHEWTHVIGSNDFLRPVPDREGVNPFTQEKVVFRGGAKAYYIQGGEKAGNLALESGEILTTGVPKSVCDTIASQLHAQVFEDYRS
jgi:hypothetical protein